MIIAFLSDAHGNDTGLDRCLAALDQLRAEQIYFLGDSVGYMPCEEAVLRRLESSAAVCIRGNHEEMLLGNLPYSPSQDTAYRLSDARERLTSGRIAWIRDWPVRREVVVNGARLLLIHGSPSEPTTGYLYPDSDLSPMEDLPYDIVFCGHTHRPFVQKTGSLICCNAGSCGMPRDVGNLASFAVYDTDSRSVEILRVEFDAHSLISAFGHRIDDSVAACLRRTSATANGRLIDV